MKTCSTAHATRESNGPTAPGTFSSAVQNARPAASFVMRSKTRSAWRGYQSTKDIAKEVGPGNYNWTGQINFDPDVLDEPYHWSPCVVFVNSMSDLFHEDVPFEWIRLIFRDMNDRPRHIFIILTKRPDILRKIADQLNWTPNIWIGVSVESAESLCRIDDLRSVPNAQPVDQL